LDAQKIREKGENMKKNKKISVLALTTLLIALMTISTVSALITPGTLVTEGSSTVLPVTLLAQSDYQTWSGITLDPDGGGSGHGYDALAAGDIDVGAHSREPKTGDWENNADLNIWAIGMDSIAILVGDAIAPYLQDLTYVEVARLFANTTAVGTDGKLGGFTTWAQADTALFGGTLGLPDVAIDRVVRPLDSGTHDCFKTFFTKKYYGKAEADNWLHPNCEEIENNIQVYNRMTSSAGDYTIAYIGLGFLHLPYLHPCWIFNEDPAVNDYVEPTKENAVAGTYPPLRWLYYSTNGAPGVEEHQWIAFIKKNSWENELAGTPENSYVGLEGYIAMYRGDLTGRDSGDATAPIHLDIPDNDINYLDIIYFVDAYIAYNLVSGDLNPYADFNADANIDWQDIIAFVDCYIAFNL
jgi:ABC-type phosphate transport system substrate-binding protein